MSYLPERSVRRMQSDPAQPARGKIPRREWNPTRDQSSSLLALRIYARACKAAFDKHHFYAQQFGIPDNWLIRHAPDRGVSDD